MFKKKVLVAMSGGVDSSVAAFLLKEEKKYDVIGANFKLFDAQTKPYYKNQNTKDAQAVCEKIGIPFYSFDYSREFKEKVINYFCAEYSKGKTPNPCVMCNEKIKFGALFSKAKSLGADYIATGHYARKAHNKKTKRYVLKKSKDKNKDQSYFLFFLTQGQLKSTLFPLGGYTKEEVRQIAKKIGLKTHNKPESQDVCFIYGRDYHEFLETHLKGFYKPGPITRSKGEVVGKHKGIPFYTIGQRKGLGPHKKAMYVTGIDSKKNVIVIGEEKELYQDTLFAEKVTWTGISKLKEPLKVKAKTRYGSKESEAVISPTDKGMVNPHTKDFGVWVKVKFAKPQRAITPGQAVVFYNKDIVVGGGWIK